MHREVSSTQKDGRSWKAKLKPGAVQLLSQVTAEFENLWERYWEAIPRDEIEKANLKDMEWDNYYRDLRADAGIDVHKTSVFLTTE